MKKEERITYEEAMRELQDIVQKMENNEPDIDELTGRLKRAQTLINICKRKLFRTETEVKKMLGEADA